MKKFFLLGLIISLAVLSCSKSGFESNWNSDETRTWIGPDYWSNPMQDWQVEKGLLICNTAGPDRSVHLLTHQTDTSGNIETSVMIGLPVEAEKIHGWGGFIIGAKGEFNDYRDAAVYGRGISAGVTTDGMLFIGKFHDTGTNYTADRVDKSDLQEGLTLSFFARRHSGKADLVLKASGKKSGKIVEISVTVPTEDLAGNIALQSHLQPENGISNAKGFWFAEWKVSGAGLTDHPERSFGPVLFTLYSLSKNVLKLTAQMPPLTPSDSRTVQLEIIGKDNSWEKIAGAQIDSMARTATFRVEDWPSGYDVPYRVTYNWSPDGKNPKMWYYEGHVKNDPVDKEVITVAAFTGNNDLGFPNTEITRNVLSHQPDLLVFTGDQIYEPRGGFGITIEPIDKSTLDYLRKWYMFGWEYGTMLKDIPSVCLPDDHDVYHGNLWGCGGKAAKRAEAVKDWQDDGGYKMPAEWVNMVQRTQTAHMPDPYDPTPVLQDISVYYTDMHLGGISFAVIEDRKWKSAPKALLPAKLQVMNGWAESSRMVNPGLFDVDAELLGERQLKFLENWAGDWSDRIMMKSVISQTLFCTIATLPDSAQSDVVVSRLRITAPGEYPPDDIPTQDMDSDGWPRKGRDQAVKVIRKAFAVHISGDQHLASSVRYGVDNWGDGSYAICVPSISNYFPRRWFPKIAGKNRKSGDPVNTGDFTDGFGNKMTVLAVANPVTTGLSPSSLYDRSAGYGIIKFNKRTREIEIANWPRQTDPSKAGSAPYDGWPISFSQFDNYDRPASAWLPELKISGTELPPVIRITEESKGELVYAVRLKENSFRPRVFSKGTYTVEAGEPGTPKWKTIKGVRSVTEKDTASIRIMVAR